MRAVWARVSLVATTARPVFDARTMARAMIDAACARILLDAEDGGTDGAVQVGWVSVGGKYTVTMQHDVNNTQPHCVASVECGDHEQGTMMKRVS